MIFCMGSIFVSKCSLIFSDLEREDAVFYSRPGWKMATSLTSSCAHAVVAVARALGHEDELPGAVVDLAVIEVVSASCRSRRI